MITIIPQGTQPPSCTDIILEQLKTRGALKKVTAENATQVYIGVVSAIRGILRYLNKPENRRMLTVQVGRASVKNTNFYARNIFIRVYQMTKDEADKTLHAINQPKKKPIRGAKTRRVKRTKKSPQGQGLPKRRDMDDPERNSNPVTRQDPRPDAPSHTDTGPGRKPYWWQRD